MMLFILMPCNILTILLLHFNMISACKPSGHMVLGVYLPQEHINDEKILAITSKLKLQLKALFWMSLLSQALMLVVKDYPSLSTLFVLIFLFGIITIYTLFFGVYSEKILKLKKEKGWIVGSPSIISLDTEVTRLQNTFPVSAGWFIPGIIILFIVSFWMTTSNAERPFFYTAL